MAIPALNLERFLNPIGGLIIRFQQIESTREGGEVAASGLRVKRNLLQKLGGAEQPRRTSFPDLQLGRGSERKRGDFG